MAQRTTVTTKYLALDTHQATSVYSVRNEKGRILAGGVVETSARDLVGLARSWGKNVHVAFEEGTQAQWIHDLLLPFAARIVVVNARQVQKGLRNKTDAIDADLLSELLRRGSLRSVWHERHSTRALHELVHGYVALVSDATRVMSRIKAVFRARGIRTGGSGVFNPKLRNKWLEKLDEPAARIRLEYLYSELDMLREHHRGAKASMLSEARTHPAHALLQSLPYVGPVRAAMMIAIVGTPHRFRTKRQIWTYAGLSVIHQSTSDHIVERGQIQRRRRPPMTRGLNRNFNHLLKKVFKDIAVGIGRSDTPLGQAHRARIEHGMRPELSLLTLARQVSAIILSIWKKGVPFDPSRVSLTHHVPKQR